MDLNSSGRILIIDDEPAIVAMIQGWLNTVGYVSETAPDGEQGIAKAKEISPDAIVMDASMPVMSGFDALMEMKKDPALAHIPVIFLTVRNDTQDVVAAMDSGATDYMTKPFKPQILLARLRAIVRQKKWQDELTANMKEMRELLSSILEGEGAQSASLVVSDVQRNYLILASSHNSQEFWGSSLSVGLSRLAELVTLSQELEEAIARKQAFNGMLQSGEMSLKVTGHHVGHAYQLVFHK